MKVLVTGGAGFIGSNLVKLLLEKNLEVRVYDNLSTGYIENLQNLDVEFVKGDVRDKVSVEKAAEKVDTVFHLAANIGNVKSLQNPQEDSEINVVGTINILEAMRKNQVSNLVYSSSAAIFGELKTMPISETHPQDPDSPYGVSKLSAEKQVLCYSKIYGMRTIALRYFNVYGCNQRYDAYGNVIPIFARKLYSKEPLTIYGDGEQTRDFVNVRDVAMANYLASIKTEKSGCFNVGSGQSITINKLAELMQDYSNTKVQIKYDPPRKSEVLHCRADISKISQELCFAPSVRFTDGIKEYIEWFYRDMEKK
jgi:nucleoside-diphosphate-sugar epimerase